MRTVTPKEVSKIAMVNGNEKEFTRVVDGDNVLEWVGFGWIAVGDATHIDRERYPVVERDND